MYLQFSWSTFKEIGIRNLSPALDPTTSDNLRPPLLLWCILWPHYHVFSSLLSSTSIGQANYPSKDLEAPSTLFSYQVYFPKDNRHIQGWPFLTAWNQEWQLRPICFHQIWKLLAFFPSRMINVTEYLAFPWYVSTHFPTILRKVSGQNSKKLIPSLLLKNKNKQRH